VRHTAIDPRRRRGPLLHPVTFQDTKDPCPVHDGRRWHVFGSGGSSTTEVWEILHAVADELDGPWTELEPSVLRGVDGDHVAAPGIVHEGGLLHMFVQTDHAALGGTIEHLVSRDDGRSFVRTGTALTSVAGSGEACIYDPHPAEVHGVKYLVYSAAEVVGAPDIHLARSTSGSWRGPWERLGSILRHEDVPHHHNTRGAHDYEWGLEGAQLVPLPDGRVLLNAVCFLPGGEPGTRQRVFFAIADQVAGPYVSLGPVLAPAHDAWGSGENGHACALVRDDQLVVLYQARGADPGGRWRYGVAEFALEDLVAVARREPQLV